MNDRKFTVKEVAEYLNVSESTIRKAVREKTIPYYRIYKKIFFSQKDTEKWIIEKQGTNFHNYKKGD